MKAAMDTSVQHRAHQNVDLDMLFHGAKDRKFVDKDLAKKDEMVVNCLRCIAMDCVQQANSGHPGTPMALAPVAYAVWARCMRYDPIDPRWMNRDRFVLSCGHASTLIYGLIHLAGVRNVMPDGRGDPNEESIRLEDLKAFRQHESRCPGHPEYRWTAGVETTTGPLGQGVANSVGMAIASKWYAATYNREGFELFDYDIYTIASDGDLQEGVSAEAASLAGHLRLDNLCWIWDNNNITIEGNTAWAISEDVATRFIAYNWNVLRVGDANDVDALTRAMKVFKNEKQRPTLIVVDSHIAWGAPTKQDTFSAHGAPLGDAEVKGTKEVYGWPDEKFLVPPTVLEHFRGQLAKRGGEPRKAWEEMYAKYKVKYPEEAKQLAHIKAGELPEDWDKHVKEFPADPKGLATRLSGAQALNMCAQGVPWMLGGSADLGNSCLTTLKFPGVEDFMAPITGWGTYKGRNFHFGIREHAMGSICNGMAISGLRPFCSTFMVFSDYMKPPLRLSAIMEIPCIWVFTHDSIGVGEDGPTHQPIEHLAALRSIPGLHTFRPCDANETLEMYKHIMKLRHEPAVVVLSRQPLPTLDRTKYAPASNLTKGGYVLISNDGGKPDIILMATGSEVTLMLQAYELLIEQGVKARAVSIPCKELFRQQSEEYMASVLPDSCRARVSIEAATRDTWGMFIGLDGEHIGMITFGASGPINVIQKDLGFTVEHVMAAAKRVMDKKVRSLANEAEVIREWKRRKTTFAEIK
jgi:transketolase